MGIHAHQRFKKAFPLPELFWRITLDFYSNHEHNILDIYSK
jgi:hypothetical protein